MSSPYHLCSNSGSTVLLFSRFLPTKTEIHRASPVSAPYSNMLLTTFIGITAIKWMGKRIVKNNRTFKYFIDNISMMFANDGILIALYKCSLPIITKKFMNINQKTPNPSREKYSKVTTLIAAPRSS